MYPLVPDDGAPPPTRQLHKGYYAGFWLSPARRRA